MFNWSLFTNPEIYFLIQKSMLKKEFKLIVPKIVPSVSLSYFVNTTENRWK